MLLSSTGDILLPKHLKIITQCQLQFEKIVHPPPYLVPGTNLTLKENVKEKDTTARLWVLNFSTDHPPPPPPPVTSAKYLIWPKVRFLLSQEDRTSPRSSQIYI